MKETFPNPIMPLIGFKVLGPLKAQVAYSNNTIMFSNE